MVTFNPVVEVQEMSVDIEEHAQEIKNPQNFIEVIPDKFIAQSSKPGHESSPNIVIIAIIIIIAVIVAAAVTVAAAASRKRTNARSRNRVIA